MTKYSVFILLVSIVLVSSLSHFKAPDSKILNTAKEGSHGNVKSEKYESDTISAREGRQKKKKVSVADVVRDCYADSSNSSTQGTCMAKTECEREEGTINGQCGSKGHICCSMEKTCSSASRGNNTNFVNKKYPQPDVGTGACTLTINRLNENICQMKFHFITLELSQPDSEGNCVTDFLTVTGGTSEAPIICGSNTGQHMYVDVDPEGGAVRLTVDRTAGSMSERMWNVQVSQIECTSKYRAPAGCLQYFTETSGTVSSFNFHQEIETNLIPQTTRQIVDMNYAVCIQKADGYCSIIWARNTTGGDYAFSVSTNVAGLSEVLIGDPASSSIGNRCETDYIVLPGAIDNAGNQNDRYCGAGFPNWVTSNFRPFIMFVKTDNNEKRDVHNRGFSLDYRQTIC